MPSVNSRSARSRSVRCQNAHRTVTVFSDCSGLEAVVVVVRGFALNCKMLAGCDNGPLVKRLWKANHDALFFDDITTRNHKEVALLVGPICIYMAGCP